MRENNDGQSGATLVELMVTMFVFLLVAFGFLGLFTALLHSAVIAKRQGVGLTLATNQMEYLKSLPYDGLAVSGGSIIATSYIPATKSQTINGYVYKTTTAINYVDDAYDGCANYPSQALKVQYCRGFNSNTTSTVDTNPADYKIVDVTVSDPTGVRLANTDTEISSRVAETASTTGAMFITVVDNTGAPVNGAAVHITNNQVTPAVSVSDTTDNNGVAVFYGLPPDNNPDYVASASTSNYSSLNTIAANGSLQPTYANLTILNQQSSAETLVLKPMSSSSLALQTTDTAGNPLPSVKVYIKGGYKSYTSSSDTSYYYDNLASGDNRPTTDASGQIGVTNLTPGNYYFCGDSGATSCSVGGITYYLAAAVPYSGSTALSPISVPTYRTSDPAGTTYAIGGVNYLQKVQLMLTSNSRFPRITSLSPSVANVSGSNLSNFVFSMQGANLPCTATSSSCSTTVKVQQGANVLPASCTGSSVGTSLSCTVNLSSATVGGTQLVISTSNGSLTLPASPELGGISIEN